jgi:hypothetical protein
VLQRSFDVDRTALCLADGDLGAAFTLVVAHWDAPDGTRVVVEGGANDPPAHLVLRSEPPRSEAELLAMLLTDR